MLVSTPNFNFRIKITLYDDLFYGELLLMVIVMEENVNDVIG